MNALIQDQPAPTVSVNPWLVRVCAIVRFLLNLSCLQLASIEYWLFSCCVYPSLPKDAEAAARDTRRGLSRGLPIAAGQESSRIAYLVIIAILTMISAIECGVMIPSRSKQPKKNETVYGLIYYAVSGVLLLILFAVLLVRFCEGETEFRMVNYLMVLVMLETFANAAVHMGATTGAGAWLILNRIR